MSQFLSKTTAKKRNYCPFLTLNRLDQTIVTNSEQVKKAELEEHRGVY